MSRVKVIGGKTALKKKAGPVVLPVKAKTSVKEATPVKAKEPKGKRVTFTLAADVGRKVLLAGSFTKWLEGAREMTDKKGDGNYSLTVTLAPGVYEYKFVVDGTWCADPMNNDVIPNDLGTFNSVKRVTE